ncbi:MAG: hypothetical protein WBP93_21575 [Pyrinomonadaceae bacterium]
MNRLPPIIEGAHGITNLITWIIFVREDWDFISKTLDGRGTDSQRSFELVLTLNHETVHFLQGLTTAFTYGVSINFWDLFRNLASVCKQDQLHERNLQNFQQSFKNFNNQFLSTSDGLSTLDLLESMAVTEAFRATSTDISTSTFLSHIEYYFPEQDSVYRKTIDIVRSRFGSEAAFNLTPKLCFIALNGDTPAKNFWLMLDRLKEADRNEVARWSAIELSKFFEMPHEDYFINRISEIPQSYIHPILSPYLELLKNIWSADERVEFAAMPGKKLREIKTNDPVMQQILPPLIAASGGRGMPLGLAASWERERVYSVIAVTALMGTSERLVAEGRPYHPCPHIECPVHETALCHAMYPPSMAVPWEDCNYHIILPSIFGKKPNELMELRKKSGLKD